MSKLIGRKSLVAAMGIVVAATLLISSATADETIAWWRFDTASPWSDSSGNGYDLLGMAASVADDFDGAGTEGAGGAYFNGIDSWATTLSTVDLTPYEAVRMSWWQKVDSTSLGITFEQSADYHLNQGGIAASVNNAEGTGVASVWAGAAHTEWQPHDNTGVWEQHTVEYWPTAYYASDVVKVYRDGVLQPDGEAYPNTHPRSATNSFVNDMFNFGARNAGSEYFFEGNLDEVKLESFTPELPQLVEYTDVVAQWTFDNATTPWADSSGNGHDLVNAGTVTQSSEVMAGQTGSSAYFDGAATGILETASTLDLSSYRSIQISWSQLLQTDTNTIIFEHSSNMDVNPGGFHMLANCPATKDPDPENGVGEGVFVMRNDEESGATRLNMVNVEHAHGTANTTWEEMMVQIDLDAESNRGVTMIYRDGVFAGSYDFIPLWGLDITDGDAPATLLNDVLYLGGRDDGVAPITGYLDNFTIAIEATSVDLPGDANKDGKVDGSDVTILAGNWQVGVDGATEATWAMGDFNGDKKVDGSDVTILAGNWQAGVTTAAASVPEPETILLILSAIGSLLLWKRMK